MRVEIESMKILAVDTATQACSVAVENNGVVAVEVTLVSKTTHSRHLMELIDKALSLSGIKLSDLEAYAVTAGPGSFTGLRIGLSVIKGLCSVTGGSVVGVSSLDALAYGIPWPAFNVVVMIDARKGEVYTASYRSEGGVLHKASEDEALEPEKLLARVSEKTIFIGSGSVTYRDLITAKVGDNALFQVESGNNIKASTVAALARKRLERGDGDNLSSLVPFYLRRSDAEIDLEKKQQAGAG